LTSEGCPKIIKSIYNLLIALTWFSVHDQQIERDNGYVGDKGSDPTDEEHDGYADKGGHQTEPGVVVFEGRSPANRFGQGGVERAEVDQSVRSQVEI